MTSCYILKQISTKANLLNSPNTWGGGGGVGLSHKLDYHKTLTSTSPLTIMWCYISKRSFTNVNLLNSPNSWGGWLSHKPDYHKTPPPLLTMMSCYILKQTSTKVNLLNSPNKNPKISSLGDNCSPPNIWSETQKTKPTKQTNKQTKTQGLLVTSWSCFPLTSSPAPYLLPFPKRWYHMRPVPTKWETSRKISFSSYNQIHIVQILSFKMIYYMSWLLPYLGSKSYHFLEKFLCFLLIFEMFNEPYLL